MPSIYETIWTQGKKIISFPHDVAAENRSKSIRQRSPAGLKTRRIFTFRGMEKEQATR